MKRQTNTTLFFYQNGKLTTVSEKDRPRTIFRAEDMPLAEQHAGDAGTPGLLATDDKGSVLTVQSNDEKEDHAYSAYGHDPSLRTSKVLLGFNGECIEPATESYFLGNGYRGYYPRFFRFKASDSLSPFDEGGFNSYAYCAGDPINYQDPSGHMPNSSKTSTTPIGIKPTATTPKGIMKATGAASNSGNKKTVTLATPKSNDKILSNPGNKLSSSSDSSRPAVAAGASNQASKNQFTIEQNIRLNQADKLSPSLQADKEQFHLNQFTAGLKRMRKSPTKDEKLHIEEKKKLIAKLRAQSNQASAPTPSATSTNSKIRNDLGDAMLY